MIHAAKREQRLLKYVQSLGNSNKKLKTAGQDAKANLNEMGQKAKEKVNETAETIKENANDANEQAKGVMDQVKETAEQLTEKAMEGLNKAVEMSRDMFSLRGASLMRRCASSSTRNASSTRSALLITSPTPQASLNATPAPQRFGLGYAAPS